jgi:hypothetical protein
MTTPRTYQSERDAAPWRPAPVVVNPQSLPIVWHVLTAASQHAGWSDALLCGACPFATRDLGDAARHLASTQYVVGYRPPEITVERPDGHADERDD